MTYSKTNSKGITYYLHRNNNLYWFAKTKGNKAVDIPSGYTVGENKQTGLLYLKET